MNTNLFKCNANGDLEVWAITALEDGLALEWGQYGGQLQRKLVNVELNSSGRSMRDQIALEFNSRVNKQMDKGYCDTPEAAVANKGRNAMALVKPMLANVFGKVKGVDLDDMWVQYKYNGHRCLITNTGGEYVAYSRNGKIITTIDHIKAQLSIPEGCTLDGELYFHGYKLQTISSLIKRQQPGTEKLTYRVYDFISKAADPYSVRMSKANDCLGKTSHVSFAPTDRLSRSDRTLQERLNSAIDIGYEGLMLRQEAGGYKPGMRSNSLLKLKKAYDQEFVVLDITPSKDGWAVLTCGLSNGETFKVSAPGTINDKISVLKNKHLYLGQPVTVEFFDWTLDNKPFHPVATHWGTHK